MDEEALDFYEDIEKKEEDIVRLEYEGSEEDDDISMEW
jgi:hypothetical protein